MIKEKRDVEAGEEDIEQYCPSYRTTWTKWKSSIYRSWKINLLPFIVIPDMIPMIDEIILGLLAIILSNWKKERSQEEQGNLIKGEIIDEDDK